MIQDNDKKSFYKVQALERALDIIDCFSFQNRELSLSDVVHRTGLNKTTAKRLISNLTTRGYLQQDPQSKKYQLGMRLFELGGIVAWINPIYRKHEAEFIYELESLIIDHPKVAQVCVVPTPNPVLGRIHLCVCDSEPGGNTKIKRDSGIYES